MCNYGCGAVRVLFLLIHVCFVSCYMLQKDKQEAQLLLGDRATRKHAKDS